MKNYQVYLYPEDTTVVLVELFDAEWANFNKGFDEAFALIARHLQPRYDIILKLVQIHTNGRHLPHLQNIGQKLKQHPEVYGIVNIIQIAAPFRRFFDRISEIVATVILKHRIKTDYVETLAEALLCIAEWRQQSKMGV
jgi:hypothetical protein